LCLFQTSLQAWLFACINDGGKASPALHQHCQRLTHFWRPASSIGTILRGQRQIGALHRGSRIFPEQFW